MSIESIPVSASSRGHGDVGTPLGRGSPALGSQDGRQVDTTRADTEKGEVVNTPALSAYGHGFMDPALAGARRAYFKIVGRATVLVILLMWAALPLYWGALADAADLTGNLDAWYIDRDDSRIGRSLWSTFSNTSAPGEKLRWTSVAPADAGTDEDVAQAVIDERVWVAVVIQPNATELLSTARSNGDSTFDPQSLITVYYNQARFVTATGTYVIPITKQLLADATAMYATDAAQRYLAQVNGQGDVNATALQLLAQAPQTIAPGVAWTEVNLRPYTAPVALAVTLVGNIFLCIFAFITTMANNTARALIQRHLRLRSYIALRILVPLAVYLPLSLSYSLVSLAFHLPFGARYSYAGGFFLFVLYVYLGMAALGLALESMVTVLGPKYAPLFLFGLIIANISAAVLPNELQRPIYMYSTGFPVWNLLQAIQTIIFNTRSYLGRNAGVLVAWILLSCATLTLFTWGMRRREKAQALKATAVAAPDFPLEKEKEKGMEKGTEIAKQPTK